MTRGKARREDDLVRRPLKRAEYGIVFITRQAEKGWKDGLATYRNAIVDGWEHLCVEPAREDGRRVYFPLAIRPVAGAVVERSVRPSVEPSRVSGRSG